VGVQQVMGIKGHLKPIQKRKAGQIEKGGRRYRPINLLSKEKPEITGGKGVTGK